MEHNNQRVNVKTMDIVQVSLMAAIIYLATAIIHVPSYMGVIHLGDSMVFLAAILLGRKKAAVASAIGMSLFDILTGYMVWAPFTFIIKGVMAYLAGKIAYRNEYDGNNVPNNILAFIVGGVWMIGAYYFGGVIIAHFILVSSTSLKGAMLLALKDIPGNILQVTAGAVIALPLSKILKKANVVRR